MRLTRFLLVMLLTVLLPVKGAVAAAMLCAAATAGSDAGAMLRTIDPAPVHGHHEAVEPCHEGDDGVASHDAPGEHHAPSHGTCQLCAGCCSVPPVPATVPPMQMLLGMARVPYVRVTLPAPLFVCTGPERPPRSA